MNRYTAQTLVDLPRLSAPAAVTLTTQLAAAATAQARRLEASGQSLSPLITRALNRLEGAGQRLATAIQPTPAMDPGATRAADRALDRAWSALDDLLLGWSKLPLTLNPWAKEVAALRALFFPSGLSFLLLPFRSQWQESQERLDGLEATGLERALTALGGGIFLENLHRAHADYGDALGITGGRPRESGPAIQEKLEATLAAMRDYVTKVVAWVDPEEPGSEVVAEALLRPLAMWEGTGQADWPKDGTAEGEEAA